MTYVIGTVLLAVIIAGVWGLYTGLRSPAQSAPIGQMTGSQLVVRVALGIVLAVIIIWVALAFLRALAT